MAIDPSPELVSISRQLAVEMGLDEGARLKLLESYLDFLCRAARTREPSIPSISVDEIWHQHILHTQSYARDCSQWFGSFIHHQPHSDFGNGAGKLENLANCGVQDPAPCDGIGARAECGSPEPPPCNAVAGAVNDYSPGRHD